MKIFAALMMLAAGPALATPPQVVEMQETVLGLDADHLYVLRVTEDNMGLHTASQKDILLIARRLADNVDDGVWPVMRTLYMAPDAGPGQLDVLPLPDRADPFGILAERGARPLLGDGWTADEIAAGPGGLRAVERDAIHGLDWASVGRALEASLRNARAALPPLKVEGEDMLLAVRFDPEADCRVMGAHVYSDGTPDDYSRVRVVASLRCENDDSMAPVQMLLVLPPT